MINAARGSGIANLKPFEVIFMFWGALEVLRLVPFWQRIGGALCYSGMCLAMFWIGTGELMEVFNPIYDNWRFWEMILGAGWTLIIFIPLWLRRVI